jgi:RNA polymerase sigma-70 factor (ECF subfamily)
VSDDAEEWAARVLGHAPVLVRFASAFTPNRAEAEDLVQETILRAYRSRDGFRGEASELSWLRRILRNLAIDRARRPDREVSVEDVEAHWRDDAYTVDVADVVAAAERREDLLDALSRLSYPYRTMVVLHDVEGWTVAAAAEELGIALPAAKQRLRRGRMALVSALAAEPARRVDLHGVPLRCWDARRHVSDYLDDTLDAATRAAVEAHVAGCPTCPALVAGLVSATDALGALRDPDTVMAPELAARIRARLGDG